MEASRQINRYKLNYIINSLLGRGMANFISCDWGTSALRLRLVDTINMSVSAEIKNKNGNSSTFELWKHGGKSEDERLSFYQAILSKHIDELEQLINVSLQGIPVIVSGMASSGIGMLELPYKDVPFDVDGHNLTTKIVEANDHFKHWMLMISGIKTTNDVMRGEETKLIGCIDNNDSPDGLFVFPGTHSKHVSVKDGKVEDFKTYMTGEFFALLSKSSILSNNVDETNDLLNDNNLKSFSKGVTDSLHANLLHASFIVRTNYLFGKLSKQENYCYLSGLLIGTELRELTTTSLPITIVSDDLMYKFYSAAIEALQIHNVQYKDADKALIDGQAKIYKKLVATTTAI